VRALDAGRPLRARGCGPVALGAGQTSLSAPPGRVWRLDVLALATVQPGQASGGTTGVRLGAPPPAGRVVDPGEGDQGRRENASVRAGGPAWLVLGESYSEGWRARCDGEDLGEPVPLQGYANAWPIDAPGCRDVDFAFGPQRLATAGYAISGLASLALLGLLILRRRRAQIAPDQPEVPVVAPDPAPVWAWRPALAAGAVAAIAGGFVFALRAGVVIGPLVVVILRYGIGPRRLALAAGALLAVVVPILYLAIPVDDKGGYGTATPLDRLAAHWVAVAAYVLLLVALAREISVRRRAAAGRTAAAPEPEHRTPPHTAPPAPPPRTRTG
jgi:hypothetical protein